MLRPGQMVMVCAIALLTIGVVMVSSAKMGVQPLEPGADPVAASQASGVTPKSIILSRSTAYMCVAVLAMFGASWMPVRRLAGRASASMADPKRRTIALLAGTAALVVVLSSVYWPVIGREVNGSARWVNLRMPGLESFQPSELAKWGLIPLVAWYAGVCALDADNRLRKFFFGLVPALVAIGAVAGFVVLEDLGTGFLMGVVACLVLLAAGARLWHFLMFVPVAGAGLVFAIIESPYRLRRITSFLDPFADPQGDGYHMIQSMTTVSGAGPFGRGLGHGLQKFGYLPEDTTDFLFAIICEELGLAGATLVIMLYAVLLWTMIGIVRRTESPVLKLVALGVTATVGLQACINLVVVTGLGPTKGIALPMISSGGTGWILTAMMLGVVVAIDRPAAHAEEHADDADATKADDLDDPDLADGEIGETYEPAEIVVPRRVKPRVRITPIPAAYE
ncbi:MAG: stage V sporulation protein E [Phycisphaeraceae bacterium]|nr:MAG: stage V sporulation protein E [Phycisphaeraceae bacterium]